MASSKCHNKGSIGVVHPLKLSKVGYDAFEREMDSFQFETGIKGNDDFLEFYTVTTDLYNV
eukprot:scaffold6550_cov184-Chaetoceros_neogracile.AAC.3